jgi:hypothetical protein
MTYWGAPGAGGKFYKGSSADSAWNHDLLWKVRVEKEVNELNPDSQVQVIPDYTTGVSDRKWSQAELKMLKEGVRLHGAGNFDTILNNPKFEALRTHSETALREKWRMIERSRLKGVADTKAEFRRIRPKHARTSPLRRNAMQSMSSPSLSRRGAPPRHRPAGGGSGVLGAEDLPGLGVLDTLKKSLNKEAMYRQKLVHGLEMAQRSRDETAKDLARERDARVQAEQALRKYQRVLNTLMKSGGQIAIDSARSRPATTQSQLPYSARSRSSNMSRISQRDNLKRVLAAAETGNMDPSLPLPLEM